MTNRLPDPIEALLIDAQRIGLLGPEPVGAHIAHARAWAAGLEPTDFLDLGSGAGVPGLVMALLWPTVSATLLDGQTRRTAWLRGAAGRLGIAEQVEVVEGRAEDRAHEPELRGRFGLVVARGFGPPAATAECASGFLAVGGQLSVSEPPIPDPKRWPRSALGDLGMEIVRQVVQPSGSFVILRKTAATEERFPRRRNLPLRDPLW